MKFNNESRNFIKIQIYLKKNTNNKITINKNEFLIYYIYVYI